jgi:hypothetical protein
MASMSGIEVVSQYVAALAEGDTERMNALRTLDFELDFVYGDASESGPLSSEETRSSGHPGWSVSRRKITR